jgi:3',5'-cyclic AMP phosphodiesterase CpdA
MPTIRLLHASDLHVCQFLNLTQISKRRLANVMHTAKNYTFAPSYSPGKLSRFLSFLNQAKQSLDGIIMTGDIATTGRDFDLKRAFTIVTNRIVPLGLDLCLFPGNHDRWEPYRNSSNALLSVGYEPGGRDFHKIFSSFWGPKDVQAMPFTKGTFSVVVVAADLSLRKPGDAQVPTLVNKHGQGRVYGDILDEMERVTLAAFDDNATAVVWAVHFPPFCPDIGSDMRLLLEQDLVQKAFQLGVVAILAGHSHVARPYPVLPYNVRVFCAGTATEHNPAKNHFFIISLNDAVAGCQVKLENYEFDGFQDRFVRTPLAS